MHLMNEGLAQQAKRAIALFERAARLSDGPWMRCSGRCPTMQCGSSRGDVGRYSFIVRDLHPLLLAGLPAHSETLV
jgi:hypothetical protein